MERIGALLNHVGIRALIWLTVATRVLWPAALAVSMFSAIDGFATYGVIRKWDWLD